MSKIYGFILLGMMVLFFSSGCEQQSSSPAMNNTKMELFKLARINGCIDCHRTNGDVIGPSWMDIAHRYKDSPRDDARAHLIESINKGSKGNWFTMKGANGMPPLERRVSAEAIEKLVDYILLLR